MLHYSGGMDIGVCIASHVGDIRYIERAEQLGYSHAWLADSQMIWSDCYAALALAAAATSKIRIGTGVAVTGTRPAAVTAASIGTINALAPGRTFLGVGTGNTAMRMMNRSPQRIAAFEQYLQTLRPLIRGEEGLLADGTPIRHLMPDRGFVNFADPIPLYVSGFGPRSLGLAGRYGDGAVLAMPPAPAVLDHLWRAIEAGTGGAGLDRDAYYTTALTTISVLDPGETLDSPRIRAECGAYAVATLHYAYEQWRQFGKEPPRFVADVWDDYCAVVEATPQDRLHQRIHAGHNCWVLPEEERFVTAELIGTSCIVGTADQIVERLRGFEAAGLNQVMVLPAWEPRYEVLERVGADILLRMQ